MTNSPDGLEEEILRTFLSRIDEAETIDDEVARVFDDQASSSDLGGRDEIAEGVIEAVRTDED